MTHSLDFTDIIIFFRKLITIIIVSGNVYKNYNSFDFL